MKIKKRILSVLLCFAMLFLCSCVDGGPNGLGGENISLAGVKVLSKPADYFDNPTTYLGEDVSPYYFNLFAFEVVKNLYDIYENRTINDTKLLDNIEETSNNIKTVTDENVYYLYDSLRYTIKTVINVANESQTIILDPTKWNWSLDQDINSENKSNVFLNHIKNNSDSVDYIYDEYENKIKNQYSVLLSEYTNWTGIYRIAAFVPSFSEFYYNNATFDKDMNRGGSGTTWAHDSPYMQTKFPPSTPLTDETKAYNYFQDGLEYATYLFALGYDYQTGEDANAPATDYEKLFNLHVETNPTTHLVSGLSVRGWDAVNKRLDLSNDSYISVVEALDIVKDLYKKTANIVGLTEDIKTKVARFIRDYVIGKEAYGKDKFKVEFKVSDGTSSDGRPDPDHPDLNFDRCYDQVIKNIIDYACEQAPIGKATGDDGTEQKLLLGNGYMASEITDYQGDYFAPYYYKNPATGEYLDSAFFHFIEAREYQSIILKPQEEDIGKVIDNFTLWFEYNDNPHPELYTEMLDELVLTVGFRYFDHTAGDYTANVLSEDVKIKRGAWGTLKDENGEDATDKSMFFFTNDSTIPDSMKDTAASIPKGIVMKSTFDDKPAISTTIFEGVGRKRITGLTSAREYYQTEQLEGVGTFGSLNKNMFMDQGDTPGSDFIEIFFVVHKTSGNPNINYNFKVCIADFNCI